MRFRFAFLVLPFAALLTFGACNANSEGQPCDPNAGNHGNDDCQAPLVCTPAIFRCCPVDRTQSTTPECAQSSSTSDASSAPPDSTGLGDAPSFDATGDGSSKEGSAEASGEAGATGDAGDGGGDAGETSSPEAAAD
jgi:hypothetical protein